VTQQSALLSSGVQTWAGPDPSKWTATAGKWAVVTGTQHSGASGQVLLGTVNNLNQTLQSSYSGTDYVWQAWGNMTSGTEWGLGVRAFSFANEYTVNLYDNHSGGNNLYTYKWVNNVPTSLSGVPAAGTISPGTWYQVSVKAHGSSIDAYFNGVLKSSDSDATYASGLADLYGENGTVTKFDDVLVRKYAATDPTSALGSLETSLPAVMFGGGVMLGGGLSVQ
jgi:hypothetical protein